MTVAYYNEVSPDDWYNIDNIHFQGFIKETFDNKYKKQNPDFVCDLFKHQRFIKDFLQFSSPYRGLLIYHGLGVGKTRSAIVAAEILKTNMNIVAMLPASIEQNFINEVSKCGNINVLAEKGHWEFVNNKWIKTLQKDDNFKNLTNLQQAEIKNKIQNDIKERFNFIHYNGLTKNNITKMSQDFFDNKIVIIDEVHNFISRVSNNSLIAKSVYKKLIEAKNCKILLLSGTPLINKPYELSLILNLIKGYIKTHIIRYKSSNLLKEDTIIDIIKNTQTWQKIDYIKVDSIKGIIEVLPVPYGFLKNDNNKLIRINDMVDNVDVRDANLVKDIKSLLKSSKIEVSSSKEQNNFLLPYEEEKFDEMFIDYNNESSSIVNKNLLSRRINGLISYFESYDPEDYPKLNDTKLVPVVMSDDHFTKYMTIRQFEFEREMKSKIYSKKNDDNKNKPDSKNTIFKTFSRALCNFYFPDSIKRVYPSTLKNIRKDLDLTEEDIQELDDENDKDDETLDYKMEVKRMITSLYNNKDQYLIGKGLKEHGPKYYKILNNINKSKGPVLVYSQFRNVEGLKILELVLQSHGYCQLDIKKSKGQWSFDISDKDFYKSKYIIFSEEKDKNKILMDIYNSDFENIPSELKANLEKMTNEFKDDKNMHGKLIKVIMITQSGAEGISLRNVRQVHIMEPYWNDIRIKQVIGRAVRAKSHIMLPKDEREVDVFMYVTKFSKDQLTDSVVKSREKKMTSDEIILNIAKRKAKIMDGLLDIMKQSSVDCQLHYDKCYSTPKNFSDLTKTHLLYYNNIDNDYKDNQVHVKKEVRRIKKKRTILFLKSSKFNIPYYEDTMEALDPNEYEKGNYVIIGKVIENNGKMKITRI